MAAAPTLDWAPPEATADAQPQTWQPPEALEPTWTPPDAPDTPTADWTPPEAEDKPFFDFADTASALVDFGRGIVASTPAAARTLWEGLERPDKWSPDTLKALETDEAFQREMQAKTEANQAAGTSSSVGESIREAGASAGFSLGSMAAAIPATVAGAYLTRSKLGANLAGGAAGGTAAYRMAGARFLNDAFKDWQTQEEKRLNRPVTEPEKEAAYQELLPLAQNAGLWEAGPEAIGNIATMGAGKVILGLGKNKLTSLAKGTLAKLGVKAGAAAGAIGTELATETVTQVGQGQPQAQATAIAAGQDPALAQSAYPVSVEGVTQAFKDVAPQTLALSGLMMGAAGGVSLATRPFRRPEADPAATPPPLPTATAPAPTITLNGTAYTYNPNELTPDQIQTIAATGNLQDYLDAGMLQNATPAPPPQTPGTPDPANVGPPPPPVVDTPGPSIQEARQTLGDIGNVGTRAAPTSTVGRAGPAPLPRDPDGNLDLLNYLNENPIRAPRRGTEGTAAAEYDWRESGDFDPAFRSRIMQEGAPNIDQRAQEAYDLGFIPEPTPQALADEVRSAIAKRQQQRRQGPAQSKIMDEMERVQIAFDRTQERLATTGQPVNLDDLAPGDTLRIDGQPITVADIEYDEDGYTTRALLRTPTGTVRVTPETNLRADRPTSSAPLDLEDLNAQLALAAEANTGFTNTTIVATREDGSTILYPELVALAARALTAGTRFTTWAANLVKQFGQAIKRYLAGAWHAARKTSQVGALDIGGNVTRMASESGAAQNTEPSTGGLNESMESIKRMIPTDLAYDYDNKVGRDAVILWRGETTFPKVNDVKIIGGDSSAKSTSVYPTGAVYLANGGVFLKRFRVSDHPQVSQTAFRGYNLDYRLSQAKGETEKQFNKRVLVQAESDLISEARNAWEAQMEELRPFTDPVYRNELQERKQAESVKNAASRQRDEVSRFFKDRNALPAKRYTNTFGLVFQNGELKDSGGKLLGQFDSLDSARYWARDNWNPESSRAADGAGFTNTTVVGNPPDGSTILFGELVNLAEQGIRAGLSLAQWTAAMVQRFGEAVRQYLKGAWQAAKNNSEVGARANLNPNARISARPPTMAEAISGETRESQFGQRVQADDRLTDPLRAAPVSTFAVQGQQQALDQANALIRDIGLEGATAQFTNDASLPMPVRIIGLMQAALQYDARAALAQRRGNEANSAAADAATAAAIDAKATLEIFGNESGRNLAAFNTWARMSPDGQLRRLERGLTNTARQTVRGDTGVTPQEVTDLVNEEMTNLDLDTLLEDVLNEGNTPSPVNLQTGAPIARNGTLIDRLLGGLETTARAISESTTLQRTVEAIDNVLKALSGKLFADPLLLTPIGQAVLKTTRTLLLQGTKLTQAIADAIAVVRTRTPIPTQDIAPLTQAVTAAVVREVIRPILRKLAFDPNYNKREATKDMLAIGIGVMEAGRLADAVIAKRPKIAKAAQDIVRQRVMRRLSDKPRAKSRKQKLPAILDTLTLAAGAGFINERTFLNAWDAKHPLPKLTPADRVRLRQMAAAVNLLPEGILRQAEAIKFLNEVALIEGIPTSDLLVAAWYANILSGMSTQAVNVWGNAFNLALRTLAIGLTSPADFAKLNLGLTKGLQPGLREAREVLRTGKLLKVGKMDDMQKAAALELMIAQGGPRGFGQWLSYLLSVGGLTRFVFRAMGATDAVFWYSAQEGMAHAAASRLIRKTQGLKPGTPAFNAEFIRQLGGDEKQFLADMDQARTELNAAGVPVTPGAVNRRAYEIRVQRRSLTLRDASVRWADRVVMQQQPEGSGAFISWIIGGLQRFRLAGVPIFLPIAPFNRIVSNVFESSLDFAGVGILRGILGSHLSELHDPKRIRFDNLERAERFGAGVIGLTAAGFVLSMAMAVKDQDDEEVPFMVYAMGPPDPTRKGLMPKGWRPFTIKIGKNYVGFAETPLGPLLGAVGGWLDSVRYGKAENKTLTERGLLAFMHAVNSFNSMGALSTIKDLGELFQSQGSLRAAKQTALSPVPGFIPAQGFMRDVATIMDDTKISDAEVFGALVKDIPILKAYGKPALNVLGEEIKLEGTPIVRRFTNKQRPDDNIAYIQKHKLRISALPRTIEIGKYLPARAQGALDLATSDQRRTLGLTAIENGVMTPDQQFQFTKTQGEKIKEGLIPLRKSTANIPPSPQATKAFQTQLDAITKAARQTAMLQIIQEVR